MGKRILIVNVNWVGDVLFSTPFIKAVRQAHPDSHIACLLHPRCKDILESNPRLDEIIIYDEEGVHKTLIGKLRLIRELRRKRFDIVFLLHRSFTKALITRLAGIKERIGYATKNRGSMLTKIVEPSGENIHKVEYFLDIARAVGITPYDNSYEFFVTDKDRKHVTEFLRKNDVLDNDILIVLCPAGNWDPKRWPRENFASLADKLHQKFGAKIVLSAAKRDEELAMDIRSVMTVAPVMAAGKTSLKELGALLERADLVIANDSGPMHMAVAVGAKTIALFGPTSESLTGPYGKGDYHVMRKSDECEVPCYDMTCKKYICMDAIKVEDVFKEAQSMLDRR